VRSRLRAEYEALGSTVAEALRAAGIEFYTWSDDLARFYEETLDRIGREALDAELTLVEATWPETEILVLRPTPEILAASRPNPLSTEAALPTFLRTLRTLREHLGSPEIWSVLRRHLVAAEQKR